MVQIIETVKLNMGIKKQFKVIIAGSRKFQDYDLLERKCDSILSSIKDEIWVYEGCCKGTDTLAEKYAQKRGYWLVEFPAPWSDIEGKPAREIGIGKNGQKYWKKAGPYRNELMAQEADALIAFNLNNSPGTQDMIRRAKAHGLKIREIIV